MNKPILTTILCLVLAAFSNAGTASEKHRVRSQTNQQHASVHHVSSQIRHISSHANKHSHRAKYNHRTKHHNTQHYANRHQDYYGRYYGFYDRHGDYHSYDYGYYDRHGYYHAHNHHSNCGHVRTPLLGALVAGILISSVFDY